MFKRILIANRGEIAMRIIRCCREMEIETVAVYSTADREALHVQFATQAVCIGPAKAGDSYLNINNILSAALAAGCDAIHPGFGFLSENSGFARLCERSGITFIGPRPEVIERMGNKAEAIRLARGAGVPVVPGSGGPVASAEEAREVGRRIGYPLLVKASAGGGGRGMRMVRFPEELTEAFLAARAEAKACFGDEEMYLEKLIENPKHIEFQILGDQQGRIIHLGERDCSVQRRNQKLIEEAPSKALDSQLRQEMGDAAVAVARAAGYTGAGTVEFVLGQDSQFYFIEMNTRIQVEHPVTEMLTGVDLIREQIRVAAGLPLSLTQDEARPRGHAIECRINAENPAAGFLPSSGRIGFLHLPGGCGLRVDTALYPGYETSPYYDSMVAKIIVWAPGRLEAIRRARRALEELIIEGIQTSADLAHLILYHPEFLKGTYTTAFLEEHLEELLLWEKEAAKAGEEAE